MGWLIFFLLLAILIFIYPLTAQIIFNSKGQRKVTVYLLPLGFLSCPWRLRLPIEKFSKKQPKKSLKERLSKKNRRIAQQSLPIIKNLIGKIYWHKTELQLLLGFEDAARTAMLAASVNIAAQSSLAVLYSHSKGYKKYPLIDIRPLFGQKSLSASADCIFSIRIGDIIINAIGILMVIRKENKKWQGNVKSKASCKQQ